MNQKIKNVLFSLTMLLFAFNLSAQESLITDIMNVDAVSVNESEKYEEVIAEYQKTYDDEIAKLDETLVKLGEDYQKEVTALVEDFSKTLEDADEKEVANVKQSVVTQVITLTMSLKSDKKKEIQNFKNILDPEIRTLPKVIVKEKEEERDAALAEYREKVESEFNANKMVIATFKNTTHLIKTDKPTSSSDN